MRKFTPDEIASFLRQVDGRLKRRATIVLIGGSVIGLKFKGSHATSDLDLWSASSDEFWNAVAAVNAQGHVLPVQKVTIAEPPHDFEDRLIELPLPGLKRLRVLVPEAHDLAIMKIARGEAHDLDAVEDIHRAEPLVLSTLIDRYLSATTQFVGSLKMHELSFLAAVDRLFGANGVEVAEKRISAR